MNSTFDSAFSIILLCMLINGNQNWDGKMTKKGTFYSILYINWKINFETRLFSWLVADSRGRGCIFKWNGGLPSLKQLKAVVVMSKGWGGVKLSLEETSDSLIICSLPPYITVNGMFLFKFHTLATSILTPIDCIATNLKNHSLTTSMKWKFVKATHTASRKRGLLNWFKKNQCSLYSMLL